MSEVKLDGSTIFKKFEKISNTWNQIGEDQAPDALVVVMGKVNEDPVRMNSVNFFLWLLNYEFSDTIAIVTKQKVIFAGSQKKKMLLDAIQPPEGYAGPELEIVLKDAKMEPDRMKEFVSGLLSKYIPAGKRVGLYQQVDKVDGNLTELVISELTNNYQLAEMNDFMQIMHKTKIQPEIQNTKIAASLVEWSLKKMIKEIEHCIESDITIRHSKIANNIERNLENEAKLMEFQNKYHVQDASLLEHPIPVLLQSGETFTLSKFNVESDASELQPFGSAIYMNICGRYTDMSAMASRTLIINPTKEQKAAYNLTLEAITHLLSVMKVGTPLSQVYNETKQFILSKDASLANALHKNFGFGIGHNHKEDLLAINATNETKVEPGMLFHVRITICDVKDGKSESRMIAVGDTVWFKSDDDKVILTENIARRYQQISYTLDEDEDEDDNNKENQNDNNRNTRESTIPHGEPMGRTRNAKKQCEKVDFEGNIKKIQNELLDKKYEELKQRYENGEIQMGAKKQSQKDMGKIQSYSSIKKINPAFKKGTFHVDEPNNTILVPVNTESFVPFHISTINNVSKSSEGQWTYLRINFHTPSVGKTGSLLFPDHKDPNAIFIKELTLKNQDRRGDANHLSVCEKKIKELIKKAKVADQEEDDQKVQAKSNQPLVMISGRRESLDNVIIKPNLESRKTIGNLEIHKNGLSYGSTKGARVDIVFSNIKHAFFQPCAPDELVAIIHFTLKAPITLSNKKVTEVQFFKESGIAADDIDMKGGRRRMNDLDELELEERERQAKRKLSHKFYQFSKLIQEQSTKTNHPVVIDVPIDEFAFQGCPVKSVVKIRPTKNNCLVALSDFPFFVINVGDIETVYFERVSLQCKNFDMAIIFRDFHTFKRINSIPRESIDLIKQYLNEIGIIFAEGLIPMNWNNVLGSIRDDFEAFLEGAAWRFLQDDKEEASQSGEAMSDDGDDSEFHDESEDEEVSEDDDSEFSEEEEGQQSYSSEVDGDESDEGLDWDEMEKQAYEDDKKAAMRRQEGGNNKPVPQGRAPPRNGNAQRSGNNRRR